MWQILTIDRPILWYNKDKGLKIIVFSKKMQKLNILDVVALILVIVGGLNWGLYVFGVNLVELIFGSVPWLVSTVYLSVGLSAVYLAVVFAKLERK
jgi:hypothetical protein